MATVKCAQQYLDINSPGTTISMPYSKSYYYLYLGVILAFIVFFNSNVRAFFHFNITSAKKLYQKALSAVVRTKLSFFDTTPQGRIINRLVKDTEAVDFTFPRFWIIASS